MSIESNKINNIYKCVGHPHPEFHKYIKQWRYLKKNVCRVFYTSIVGLWGDSWRPHTAGEGADVAKGGDTKRPWEPPRPIDPGKIYIRKITTKIIRNWCLLPLYLPFSDWFGTQTDVSACVPNQLENGEYNLISVLFNKNSKRFLCVCSSDWLLSKRNLKLIKNKFF